MAPCSCGEDGVKDPSKGHLRRDCPVWLAEQKKATQAANLACGDCDDKPSW